MNKRKEVFMVFCISFLLLTMAAVGIVWAPPDPPEGESSDTEYRGDFNWFLYATVWGHWTWKPTPPPPYYFDELKFSAIRGGGIGVWPVGDLTLTYEYSGTPVVVTTTPGSSLKIDVFPNNFPTWAQCKSKSKFATLISDWIAETLWASISI